MDILIWVFWGIIVFLVWAVVFWVFNPPGAAYSDDHDHAGTGILENSSTENIEQQRINLKAAYPDLYHYTVFTESMSALNGVGNMLSVGYNDEVASVAWDRASYQKMWAQEIYRRYS